jgi:hypothetical protein
MTVTQKTTALVLQAWTTPRLNRLGKIADVAGPGKSFQGNGS